MRRIFKSKIHRATITHADLHYEGSLSIDIDLMNAADIIPYEEVHVWNITNGARITTYAIEATKESGIICANGAAAHLFKKNDLVIIATFASMQNVPTDYQPTVIRVDSENRQTHAQPELAGPALRK